MNMKKLIIILNILSLFILTGCENKKDVNYNSDIKVNGPVLKISLIQTAYEIYELHIKNTNNEPIDNLYDGSSRDAKKHYKWLIKTYKNLDSDMIKRLENIFESNSSWAYINSSINLDDSSSTSDIVNNLISDKNLDLSSDVENDIEVFFNHFNNEYFNKYFNKRKSSLEKKASKLNNILYSNDVNIEEFINKVCGVSLNTNYVCTFYYSLNPISSQNFEYENYIVSTISPNTTVKDLLRVPFHKYSHALFDSFNESDEFLEICELLKADDKLVSVYNDSNNLAYDFNEWCEENLVEGFSKYLDYRYSQYEYDFSNFVYDLDFYNYLRKINFNPDKVNLKDACIDFYMTCIDF